MKSMLDKAKAALMKSKEDMVRYYNQHQTSAPTFTIGNRVFLDVLDISTTCPTKKFTHHYLGPFPVVRSVGLHTYQLKLAQSMLCLHLAFHVVKLMPALLDPIKGQRAHPPPPSEIVRGEARYKVEEVINSRMWGRRLQYLMRWRGMDIKRICGY
jgi:hypothetical protein